VKRGVTLKKEQVKSGKRRFSKPFIFTTIILQIILSAVICLMLVLYSPFFNTIKKFAVSSLMETGAHQYIARIFLSQAQINAITGEDSGKPLATQDTSDVKTQNAGDSDIDEYAVQGDQFSGYVLEVKDSQRVKVAMTQYAGKVGEFTSKMAESENAIAAINGGGFQGGANWSDSAQNPTNFVMHDGNVVWQDKNWPDDEKVNVIAIDNHGILVVGDHSINELKSLNVMEAVTLPNSSETDFKPLIINGEPQFKKGDSTSRAPRTAIAQKKDGTILLIALDGRQVGQFGATYYELQQLILDKLSTPDNPVETATILDGGGSTTMYYNGKVINHPSAAFGERTVATAFYVEQ
jgi:exopolysaccharide biosynthesis protein